jgi:hypothetical protein
MPEGMNVEVAHKLGEHETSGEHHGRWHELVEVVEVAILAVVAVATAWSGLQAAKWDGRQSLLYGKATSYRFQADAASTLAGLQLSADASMFTGWLQAHAAGDTQLQASYVRRFTPDYRGRHGLGSGSRRAPRDRPGSSCKHLCPHVRQRPRLSG